MTREEAAPAPARSASVTVDSPAAYDATRAREVDPFARAHHCDTGRTSSSLGSCRNVFPLATGKKVPDDQVDRDVLVAMVTTETSEISSS